MGLWISKLWSKLFGSTNEFKILILGLANAGKTTILYQFNLGKVVVTQPTIGSNVEEVINKNVKLQVWDLGGQESLRACWQTYFYETSAIIFVVDSSDRKNELISKMELFNLVANEELKDAVFLIFANKQDVEGCMSAADVTEKFNLSELKNHNWHIQACSAKKGEGLKEGLDWLTDKLIENRKK